jgi:hypothetical protein
VIVLALFNDQAEFVGQSLGINVTPGEWLLSQECDFREAHQDESFCTAFPQDGLAAGRGRYGSLLGQL